MEIQRLLAQRALHAQPLLPRFFTSTVLPPVASRAKSVWPARSCPPAAAALPESKKWGYTEFASLLAHVTDVPALKQRFLDYDLTRAAVSPERRGRQGIRLTTGSETCSVTFQHWGFMLRVHPVP